MFISGRTCSVTACLTTQFSWLLSVMGHKAHTHLERHKHLVWCSMSSLGSSPWNLVLFLDFSHPLPNHCYRCCFLLHLCSPVGCELHCATSWVLAFIFGFSWTLVQIEIPSLYLEMLVHLKLV